MMFALELRLPPPKVRARVWTRQLARHGIEAGPDDAFSLAWEFEATPGVAVGATAAVRLGGGDLAAVRHGVRSLSRVLSCEKPSEGTPARYDPALIRGGVPEGRGPGLPAGAVGAGRHAARRMRRQAGLPAGDRFSAVDAKCGGRKRFRGRMAPARFRA